MMMIKLLTTMLNSNLRVVEKEFDKLDEEEDEYHEHISDYHGIVNFHESCGVAFKNFAQRKYDLKNARDESLSTLEKVVSYKMEIEKIFNSVVEFQNEECESTLEKLKEDINYLRHKYLHHYLKSLAKFDSSANQ